MGISYPPSPFLIGVTAGTVTASKGVVVDANKDVASFRHLTITGNLVSGATTINETELGYLDGQTIGTVTASKAVVVDANKDIGTFRHLTISGNFVTGSTTLSEAELGVLDGVTPGTVTASKALVVSSNRDLSAIRNLTFNGALTGANDTASLTLNYGKLIFNSDTFSGYGEIQITDNLADALSIKITSGADIMVFDTTNSNEKLTILSAITQKLGFYGTTPVAQLAGANQAALTDSTGGSADGTVADVTAAHDQTILNNNFADIVRLVNQLRADLVSLGLIKGAA